MIMKRKILMFISGMGILCSLWSCKNGDISFPDYENGTTAYFAYQYPVRTIVLGTDEYDTTLDKEHKCQIYATFGGSYNGSNGTLEIAVDETLVNNLYFDEEFENPVKAMPRNYYELSSNTMPFNGTMNGIVTVQLTDAYFADPNSVKETYVIPVVITGQTGFGSILTGTPVEGQNGPRTDASAWEVQPKDYVLYCVKYQNRYAGFWLTNGNMSTENIEKANIVEIKTKSLNQAVYHFSDQDGATLYDADLLLDFSGDDCKISCMTDNATVTGSGSFGEKSEKKAWGNKDRDGLELNYTIKFADGFTKSVHEKLVWQRSGVTIEEFAPVYKK